MIYHASMAFVAVVEELKTCTLTRSTYDYSTQASRGRTRKVALDHALRVPLLLALWYEIRVASATLYILDVHRSKESIRLLLSSAAIASDMLATFSSMAAAMAVTWPRPQQHLKKATWTFGGGGGGAKRYDIKSALLWRSLGTRDDLGGGISTKTFIHSSSSLY
jgi:hypothetical protein